MTPGNLRSCSRLARLVLFCSCFVLPLPACFRSEVINLDHAQVQGLTLTATLVPEAVPNHNLHTADSYWLVAGDSVLITNPQQYQFTLVNGDDPNGGFTCTFTPGDDRCGNTIPITPSGPPVFGVNVLKCPGQTAECVSEAGTIVQTFTFQSLTELEGQKFPVGDEDATYSLEPTVDFHDGTISRGTPASAIRVKVVPKNMQGRDFSTALGFNSFRPSDDKWQWPGEGAAWSENFSNTLQIATITIQEGSQTIDFCGVKAASRICGCNGNQGATTSCPSVGLRTCTNFGGPILTTPSYLLQNGPTDRLSSPDDRLQWAVRFQSCGLTPPDANAQVTIHFNLIAK